MGWVRVGLGAGVGVDSKDALLAQPFCSVSLGLPLPLSLPLPLPLTPAPAPAPTLPLRGSTGLSGHTGGGA